VHIKFFSSIERVDVTDKLFCTCQSYWTCKKLVPHF